jgi:hypothetical protein
MAFETLFCIIWLNPDKKLHPQARLLQTHSTPTSTPTPLSFSQEQLDSKKALKNAFFPITAEDFDSQLPFSSPQRPLVLPTTLANSLLGWNIFSPAPKDSK